jgi:DNA replicative helicase MCM subunit Mcm2 (Cdc46/Mcm family)
MYNVNNNINNSIDRWVDFWYYEIGVNIIPANTKEKITFVNWSECQNIPITEELHEIRKKNGEYSKGIAIVLGKIWRGKYQGQYLNGIDCDNKKAIEEICIYKDNTIISLQQLANWTIVEQHTDQPDRMHIYIRSIKPFRKKSSNKINSELLKKIDATDIPAFEVKGLGQHGIFFCTPSIHKNGHPYQIIGTKEPVLCDEFENHLNSICKKYGIEYLDDYIDDDQTHTSKIPIQDLFQENFVILEGNNRHEGLLRAMESLLKRNQGILDLEQIKQLAQIWNQKHCEPPLDNKEFERQWESATNFIRRKINEQTDQVENNFKKEFLNNTEKEKDKKIPLVSVSEALRTNFGMLRVQGMITSRSNIYKMKYEIVLSCVNCGYSSSRLLDSPISSTTPRKEDCPSCEKARHLIETKSNYLNAVTAELQDIETFNEIERLPIILFDEDTKNINLGERVTVTGRIEIVSLDSRSKKKPHAVLYARSIEYESKEEIVITPKDREAIERFTTKITGKHKIIDVLVFMFDLSIIGHNYIKKGLLFAAVNTTIGGDGQDNGLDKLISKNTSNNRRERINILIIGDPGLGKTLSLKRTVKIVPNSRYESSQNSSGKSLTAIISKEDENYILRLGPVPLVKWAICALNEFGRLDPEDQGHLLDVMEEGEFTINKHGINARIVSPTTIIASANPVNNSSWSEDQKINLNEIPALKPIIDRFDLIFVVRTPKDENVIRQYTYLKSLQEGSLIPDYSNYLKKHITYAKRFNPVFSDEAKSILDEFFIRLITKNKNKKDVFNSPRRRDSIYRIAKAISKLKLKNVVDVDDANEAIEFYNVILFE